MSQVTIIPNNGVVVNDINITNSLQCTNVNATNVNATNVNCSILDAINITNIYTFQFLPTMVIGSNVNINSLNPLYGYCSRVFNTIFVWAVFQYKPDNTGQPSTMFFQCPIVRPNFTTIYDSLGTAYQEDASNNIRQGSTNSDIGTQNIQYTSDINTKTNTQTVYLSCSYRLL